MAPSPFVGINPMMANNAVLTEIKSKHQSKLLCKRNWVYSGKRKRKDSQGFTEEVQVGDCIKMMQKSRQGKEFYYLFNNIKLFIQNSFNLKRVLYIIIMN